MNVNKLCFYTMPVWPWP